MSEIRELTWDRIDLDRLKVRYELAKEKDEELFTFRGEQFVTDYAKYLTEHLSNEFLK